MLSQEEYLIKLEAILEKQLQEVIAVFQNLPSSTLLQPPAQGGWSIAECFEHLNTYAEYYHPKIQQGFNRPSHATELPLFRNTWLGLYFIKTMNSDSRQKKYKAIKQHQPKPIENPSAAISRFIQHLEDLLKLLHAAGTRDLKSIKLKTSLAPLIKINAGDAIEFLLVHNQRHIQQARRILK
ncbi:DinB family protein [Chryseotalea sanaruensis]|uniref:DinB family protein n=2 Tax=Chryseotalea sanaruensis TaxID=2482724 RepID=A0A401U595_9BACT|nr:DinB family protein [Chryseotalea sanaruensis]